LCGQAFIFSSKWVQRMKIVGFISLTVALALFWVAASSKVDLLLPSTLAVGGVWCIYHQSTLARAPG
jgi:hypothetical protein